ncbi:MAG TPA: NYN domain-containing protein [Candidatus Limnocylindrales bacterium]|nr:NYN domain-containing protein [Candidatus Limnocylindrales bacterium]
MTRTPHDPLAGATKLFVDGTNLLHALTSGPGGARQPPAAVVGRLRAAIPAEIAITLVFDGPPERGLRGERIAGGVTVRYSGHRTADEVLLQLVNDAATWSEAAASALVVTDDADLRAAIHRRGGRTAGTRWLIGRLDRPRLASPSAGNARPPKPPRLEQEPGVEENERRWSPGRGATAKRGNPRRTAKTARRTGPPDRG